MATTEFEEKPRVITPRNSRRNEIVAILLFAVGLLLTLCLVSAAFYPSDPSWNSVGQTAPRNWAGAIGANVAAFLFQSIGIAAYLLPALLLGAAWRRFRTRSIRAPFNCLLGLLLLLLSAAALLSISGLHPLFDASVQPGGLVGTLISRVLASGLNTVGATILLIAVAATGLLLATNVSFVIIYEKLASLLAERFAFEGHLPERFRAWREVRREEARLRKEKRAALKAEHTAARAALKSSPDLSPEQRIAQFMEPLAVGNPGVETNNRSEARMVQQTQSAEASDELARAAAAGAGVQAATVVEDRSGRRSIFPRGNGNATVEEEEDVEEMVKGAFVLRPKGEVPATGKLPFDTDRSKRV